MKGTVLMVGLTLDMAHTSFGTSTHSWERSQLRNHLGCCRADFLGLQVTLLLRSLNHHGLHLLLALDGTLEEGGTSPIIISLA